ncbi:hypothetical protein Taro_034269 [Colocasia esculenta]|uniref:Pentatricopeptide repeat-containing protein n=1 Tax=Colocasia esculenta TaxID=4460 RepID=A0A843WF11_COLES|nr:hypothetical protein [Colocasia esculenta]
MRSTVFGGSAGEGPTKAPWDPHTAVLIRRNKGVNGGFCCVAPRRSLVTAVKSRAIFAPRPVHPGSIPGATFFVETREAAFLPLSLCLSILHLLPFQFPERRAEVSAILRLPMSMSAPKLRPPVPGEDGVSPSLAALSRREELKASQSHPFPRSLSLSLSIARILPIQAVSPFRSPSQPRPDPCPGPLHRSLAASPSRLRPRAVALATSPSRRRQSKLCVSPLHKRHRPRAVARSIFFAVVLSFLLLMKEDEMTAIFVLLEMAKEDPRVTRSPPAAPFLLRPCSSEIREEAFAYVLPSVLSASDLLKEDNAKWGTLSRQLGLPWSLKLLGFAKIPIHITYMTLMDAYCKSGMLHDGMKLLNWMVDRDTASVTILK